MAIETVATVVERYINSAWDDISPYVVGDIMGEYMISSNAESNRVASVGELEFVVNNGDGSFSPNANFRKGTPIRVTTTYDGVSKVKFRGTIRELKPDTMEWGDQYVRVRVADWMDFATNFPVIVPEVQTDTNIENSASYLLSLMKNQPTAVEYHTGRETFTRTFDAVNKETKASSELNKLALSEWSLVYVKGDGTLVVESADSRKGTDELTTIPVSQSNSGRLLQENGDFLLQENGDHILLDQVLTPNLSGTFTGIEVDADRITNQVIVRAYPALITGTITLFELNEPIYISGKSTVQVKGAWSDPDGGNPINAVNILGMTGTNNLQFLNLLSQPAEQYLTITTHNGSEGFVDTIFNNTIAGRLMIYKKQGDGIFPYSPIEAMVSVTGSISSYGTRFLQIEQKYQTTLAAGGFIADMILDDEKDPRVRVDSITFDASSSAELMQASQYMDIGDLTYVSNVKPSVDTYAYIHGKRFVITTAGVVVEKWYLKEMDSLRKGLRMISLKGSGHTGSRNRVDYGDLPKVTDLPQKTIMFWIKNAGGVIHHFPPVSKYGGGDAGSDGWYVFQHGTDGHISFRQNFDPSDGQWYAARAMTGTVNAWHHVAVSYDSSNVSNAPKIYRNGLSLTVSGTQPTGEVQAENATPLIIGNLNVEGTEYLYNWSAEVKDVRIYNRILTDAEVAEIAANHTNYISVPSGLTLQVPTVRSEDYAGLTGTILYPDTKIIDNVYGYRGTPNWSIPSGTAHALKAYGDI